MRLYKLQSFLISSHPSLITFQTTPQNMPYSLKRGSLFYVRNLQKTSPPSIKTIYRNYLKSGLLAYRQCNAYIGFYFFKLLLIKKAELYEQKNRICNLREYINSLQAGKENIDGQKKKMFKRFASDSLQQTLIRLKLHHQHMQRIATQNFLQTFQSFYHLSKALTQSFDSKIEPNERSAQMSKIVHIVFNISEFFTPTLLPRSKYHSLLILDSLQGDMQFEGLKENDKEYVREVVIKVCGSRNGNHMKYRYINDYLKDPNAVFFESRKKKIEIGNQKKRHTQEQQQKVDENKVNQQKQTTEGLLKQFLYEKEREEPYPDQWSILNQRDRNRAVKQILESQIPVSKSKKNFHESQNQGTSLKKSLIIPQILLFETLQNLNLTQSVLNPGTVASKQLIQSCQRVFKLKAQPLNRENLTEAQKKNQEQMLKLPLLEDTIIQYPFLDEFVNQKKIILV